MPTWNETLDSTKTTTLGLKPNVFLFAALIGSGACMNSTAVSQLIEDARVLLAEG